VLLEVIDATKEKQQRSVIHASHFGRPIGSGHSLGRFLLQGGPRRRFLSRSAVGEDAKRLATTFGRIEM
jgi:hypothetical protein